MQCERCVQRSGQSCRIGSSVHKVCRVEIAKEMLRIQKVEAVAKLDIRVEHPALNPSVLVDWRYRNPPPKPRKVPVQPPPVEELTPKKHTPIEEAAIERLVARAARGGYRGPQDDREPPEARLEAAVAELDEVNAEAHRIRLQNLKANLGVTVVAMMILGAFVTLLVASGL